MLTTLLSAPIDYAKVAVAGLALSTPLDYAKVAATGLGVAALGYVAFKSASGDKYAGVNLPPGDLGWPIIGNILEWSKGSKEFCDDRPGISSFKYMSDLAVLVKDATMAEKLLRNEGRLIEANYAHMYGTEDMFGKRAVTSVQGPKHKHIRAQFLPAFSRKPLDKIFYTHQKIARRHVKQWAERGTFDGSKNIRECSADLGCAFIGVDTTSSDTTGKRMMQLIDLCVIGCRGMAINIPGIPTRHRNGLLARQEIFVTFIRPLLKDRRENPRTGEEAEEDLPTLILNGKEPDGTPFADVVIEENLLTFVIASLDTSATAFMYFVHTMCKHPEVQDKLRAEIREVLGDKYRNDEEFPHELLDEMPYLDQVLRELMRLYQVLSGLFFRRAKVDFELGGYTIPKGVKVRISSPHVASDPKVWTNPEKFDPSRFAPNGEGTKKSRLLLEYGFGTRLCMGKRMAERNRRLMAIFLLRDHRLEFANGASPGFSTYNPLQRTLGAFPVRMVPVA